MPQQPFPHKGLYLPLGGTARRYQDPYTGLSISRYQYDRLPTAPSLPRGVEETKLFQDYARNQGLSPTRLRANKRELRRFYVVVHNLNTDDHSATGRLAWALTQIGRRSLDDTWDVGATETEAGFAA